MSIDTKRLRDLSMSVDGGGWNEVDLLNEVADEIDRLRDELRKANAQWAEETQAHAAFAKMATADLEKLAKERDEALARVADLESSNRKRFLAEEHE